MLAQRNDAMFLLLRVFLALGKMNVLKWSIRQRNTSLVCQLDRQQIYKFLHTRGRARFFGKAKSDSLRIHVPVEVLRL